MYTGPYALRWSAPYCSPARGLQPRVELFPTLSTVGA